MQPSDVDNINTIIGLLKTGGNAVLVFAAYIIWRANERLTKLESAVEILKEKTRDIH